MPASLSGMVAFGGSVRTIPGFLFEVGSETAFPYIKEVTISDSVEEIGTSAFRYCCCLNKVNMGKGIREIGDYAFFGCVDLRDIYYNSIRADWNRIEIGEDAISDKVAIYCVSHDHEFSEDWSYNSASHWHACRCGETNDIAPHSWDYGKITKEPTAEKDGVMTYTCTICKATMNLPIEKSGKSDGAHLRIVNYKNITVDYRSKVIIGVAVGDDVEESSVGWFNAGTDSIISHGKYFMVEEATSSFSVYAAMLDSAGNPIENTRSDQASLRGL